MTDTDDPRAPDAASDDGEPPAEPDLPSFLQPARLEPTDPPLPSYLQATKAVPDEPPLPPFLQPLMPEEPASEPVAEIEDEEGDDPPANNERLRSSIEWVAVIVGALVVALVVKTFLFQAFYIPSESMEPTLEKGDRVLVNKISYDVHDVHRGDVIVFELDEEDVGPDGIKDLIKRVIGLPGDTIETRDGAVYINDRRVDEPYLPEGTITGDPEDGSNPTIPRQVVPDGHVFVLGDNRDNSADSRYPYRGPIPINDIVGRAFVLVWPPGDIGAL